MKKKSIFLIICLLSILLLFVGVANAQKTNKIHSKLSSKISKNPGAKQKVLIHYKKDHTSTNDNRIKARKGKIKKKFRLKPVKRIIAAELTGEDVKKLLADDPDIELIQEDYEVKLVLHQSVPLIKTPQVWENYELTGKGVSVAVIDTGVADHSALSGRIKQHLSFNEEPPGDFHGHGTHVAGIVASNDPTYKGVAPDAGIYDLKVLNKYGLAHASQVMAAVEWAINNGIDVVSMSLGAYIYCDGTDPLSQLVDYGESRGVRMIIAAGNGGPGSSTISSPGCARGAITIGSTDKSDNIAYTSSRGPTHDGRQKPDVVAPGVSITSTWNNGGFNTISGTSMATPHITGVVALLMEDQNGISRSKIMDSFAKTSKDLGLSPNSQGVGRVDSYEAMQYIHPIGINITNIVIAPKTSGIGVVNISFTVSKELSTIPDVFVNDNSANYVLENELNYFYNYQVTSDDQQGQATITITATDSEGNTATAVSEDLTIDTTPPEEQCYSDDDCPENLVCVDGACVIPEEQECVVDSDCEPKEVCQGGFCRKTCLKNKDCEKGKEKCRDGVCIPKVTGKPTPEEPGTEVSEIVLVPIKYYEAPRSWQIDVSQDVVKLEVTTYLADNPSRIDAYGGWRAYMEINEGVIWENDATITKDHTTGETFPVNGGYGVGRWVDVTDYVNTGINRITYYHFTEGPGMGVKLRVTKLVEQASEEGYEEPASETPSDDYEEPVSETPAEEPALEETPAEEELIEEPVSKAPALLPEPEEELIEEPDETEEPVLPPKESPKKPEPQPDETEEEPEETARGKSIFKRQPKTAGRAAPKREKTEPKVKKATPVKKKPVVKKPTAKKSVKPKAVKKSVKKPVVKKPKAVRKPIRRKIVTKKAAVKKRPVYKTKIVRKPVKKTTTTKKIVAKKSVKKTSYKPPVYNPKKQTVKKVSKKALTKKTKTKKKYNSGFKTPQGKIIYFSYRK